MKKILVYSYLLINALQAWSQNVGIGISAPAYPLHIVKEGAGYGMVYGAMGIELGTYIDLNGGWLGTNSNHPLNFYTNNGLQQMTLIQSGNLGIGTITPVKKLHVLGDIQVGDPEVWFASSHNRMLNFGDENYCYIGEIGANDRMELRAGSFYFNTGNVGILTSNPSAALDVAGLTKTMTFQMTSGAGTNKILQSDANGNASWVVPSVPGSHTVGESFGGGIVFYVYDNGFHGLIAATSDQSTGISWDSGSSSLTNAVRDGHGAGLFNTERTISSQDTGSYAAQICANYQGGGFGDWYLPSKEELNILYFAQGNVGGFAAGIYWSSSEYSANYAWGQFFTNGTQGPSTKSNTHYVRAIRAF